VTGPVDLPAGPLAVVCLLNAAALAVQAHAQTTRLARYHGGAWIVVWQVVLTGASLGLAATAGMVLR
jgi:hypothetical protein